MQAFDADGEIVKRFVVGQRITEAPLGLDNTGTPVFYMLWTALYAPCVNVPMGRGPQGLPLGVQIVCPEGHDRKALAWARWVQARIA